MLVVETDPVARQGLGRVLRAEGHDVLEVGDAVAALEAMRTGKASLLVLGEGPLGCTGAKVLRGMKRELHSPPPALLLTSSDSPPAYCPTADGVALGLQKPFRVEELLAAVASFQAARKAD